MRPAFAMSWLLWQRNRLPFALVAAHMALFGAAIVAYGASGLPVTIAVIGSLLLGFDYLVLIGAFVYQEADVGNARSTFPSYLLWAPARTATLVLVPMILGTLVVGGATFVLTAVARGAGVSISAWWPAMSISAALALLQLIFWSPTLFSFSKLVLTILFVPGLYLLVATGLNTGYDEFTVCKWLGLLTLTTYAATVASLSTARRGDQPHFEASALPVRRAVIKKAFQSGVQAQRWYEWRQQGLILPIIVVLLFVLLAIPMAWNDTLTAVWALRRPDTQELPMIPTLLSVYYSSILVVLPLAAWIVGCGTRRSEMKRGDGSPHLFFATRPFDEWGLVSAKFFAATKSVLLSWLLVLACSLPFLLMEGGTYRVGYSGYVAARAPVYRVLLDAISLEDWAKIGAMAFLLIVATWRAYIVGFWVEMSGRLWMRYGYPAAVMIGVGLLSVVAGNMSPRGWLTIGTLATIVWVLVILKLTVALRLCFLQLQRKMLPAKRLAVWVVAYLAAAASLSCVATYWARVSQVEAAQAGAATMLQFNGLVIGLTVLYLPAVRILGAPLMLANNRHRP